MFYYVLLSGMYALCVSSVLTLHCILVLTVGKEEPQTRGFA